MLCTIFNLSSAAKVQDPFFTEVCSYPKRKLQRRRKLVRGGTEDRGESLFAQQQMKPVPHATKHSCNSDTAYTTKILLLTPFPPVSHHFCCTHFSSSVCIQHWV